MPPRDDGGHDRDVQRELEALDAAVAGRPVDAEHAELADLARALRDDREQPTPEYTAELDRRVAEGFAGGAGELHAVGETPEDARAADSSEGAEARRAKAAAHSRRRWSLEDRALAPALGIAAAALLAVVVSVAVLTGGEEQGGEDGSRDQPQVLQQPERDAPAPQGAPAGTEPGTADEAPATPEDSFRPRRAPAPYRLRVPADRLEQALVSLTELGRGTGGEVVAVQRPEAAGEPGFVVLNVPASLRADVVDRLELLGDVTGAGGADDLPPAVERAQRRASADSVTVIVEPR